MLISLCTLHLDLPHAHSLKGRRSVTNRLKEKLKSFNVSVMDISGEYPKEADVTFVFLSPDAKAAAQYREKIEKMIERNFSDFMWEMEYEEL